MTEIDEFLKGYIEYALWASTDEGGHSLDDNYDADDLAPECLKTVREDCIDFVTANRSLLTATVRTAGYSWGQAGGDFWLTRNRHGAGYWDRGLGKIGKMLTDVAHVYGGVDLCAGDDGKIYC